MLATIRSDVVNLKDLHDNYIYPLTGNDRYDNPFCKLYNLLLFFRLNNVHHKMTRLQSVRIKTENITQNNLFGIQLNVQTTGLITDIQKINTIAFFQKKYYLYLIGTERLLYFIMVKIKVENILGFFFNLRLE